MCGHETFSNVDEKFNTLTEFTKTLYEALFFRWTGAISFEDHSTFENDPIFGTHPVISLPNANVTDSFFFKPATVHVLKDD